jgi:hypothetical protein
LAADFSRSRVDGLGHGWCGDGGAGEEERKCDLRELHFDDCLLVKECGWVWKGMNERMELYSYEIQEKE